MSTVTLTKDTFEAEVMASEIPVLIDFWAPWCGPCGMLTPIVHELADEQEGNIKVCTVNVDEEMELARRFKVMSIPTLVVFKNGAQTTSATGVRPKEEILALIQK